MSHKVLDFKPMRSSMIRSYILREYFLAVIFQFLSNQGPKLQCFIKVKDGLSEVLIFNYIKCKENARIDAVLMVKDIIVIYRNNETILI